MNFYDISRASDVYEFPNDMNFLEKELISINNFYYLLVCDRIIDRS